MYYTLSVHRHGRLETGAGTGDRSSSVAPAGRVWGALWLCADTLREALVAVSTLQADIASIDAIRVFPTVHVPTGTLLMFPAWLQHSVDPNRSESRRISISFNVMFSAYAENISRPLWGNE